MARLEVERPAVKEVKNKETIHDVYILDSSSSMGKVVNEGSKASSAFQGCVDNLKENLSNTKVKVLTTINVFSNYSQFPIIKESITSKNYSKIVLKIGDDFKGGGTALNDAIMETILKLGGCKNVSIKIFTDGQESHSFKNTSLEVSRKIQEMEALGWNISFVGTQQDVKRAIQLYSIDESNTLVHDNTSEGFKKTLLATREAMASYSTNVSRGLDVSRGFYKGIK